MRKDDVSIAQGPYRVFRFAGRPVFAVPQSPWQLRLAGLSRFQPVTRRRANYRRFMQLSVLLGVDRFLCRTAQSPLDPSLGFDFDGWLAQVRRDLDEPDAAAVVFWPPQVDRGRIYVHLFNAQMQPVGFAKISFDSFNDERLQAEQRTLGALQTANLKTFHSPRIRAKGRMAGHDYLVLEPIPPTAVPAAVTDGAFPRAAVDEYSGPVRVIGPGDLERLSWWPRFQTQLSGAGAIFLDDLRATLTLGASVCRQHGDLGPSNVVNDSGRIWIYDWEESAPDAAAYTDELCFNMAVNYRWNPGEPEESVRRFSRLPLYGRRSRADVMLALAFMQAVGIGSAAALIRHWSALPTPTASPRP